MRAKRQLFSQQGLPPANVNKIPDQSGISYEMIYGPRILGAPSVAYLERQSTRQLVVKYRIQDSTYISKFRTGLQSLIGYPIARGATIINTTPNGVGTNTGPNTQGTMRPVPRFKKALRTPIVPYNPPTY